MSDNVRRYLLPCPFDQQSVFMALGGQKPGVPTKEGASLYLNLINEEREELRVAIAEQTIVEEFDACLDMIVVITGYMLKRGIPADVIRAGWNEVIRTNMAKVQYGADGRVLFRPDGKILKPADWTPPDLKKILMDAGIFTDVG